MTKPHWELAYEEAALEVDDSKLDQKLTYAEVVIRMLLRSASGDPKQSHETTGPRECTHGAPHFA
jgi:hypothetical protein